MDSHTQGGGEVNVNLDWRIGIAAKDWDSVARKEKIEVNVQGICIIFLESPYAMNILYKNKA